MSKNGLCPGISDINLTKHSLSVKYEKHDESFSLFFSILLDINFISKCLS